jgi:hypothetical protein
MSYNCDVLVMQDGVNTFEGSFFVLRINVYPLNVLEVRFESFDNNYFYGEQYAFADIFFIKDV